ncbi:hypothetical protein [Burkholderia glumae]
MRFDWLILDANEEINDSISARMALLRALLHSAIPDDVDKNRLVHFVSTQGALAKLDLPELSIKPISLNTLKQQAHKAGDKWKQLDGLRLTVLEHLKFTPKTGAENPRRRTIEWYKRRVDELEEELNDLRQELVVVTRAFDKAFFNARFMAQSSGKALLKKLCEEREVEIRHELSFRHRPHGERK